MKKIMLTAGVIGMMYFSAAAQTGNQTGDVYDYGRVTNATNESGTMNGRNGHLDYMNGSNGSLNGENLRGQRNMTSGVAVVSTTYCVRNGHKYAKGYPMHHYTHKNGTADTYAAKRHRTTHAYAMNHSSSSNGRYYYGRVRKPACHCVTTTTVYRTQTAHKQQPDISLNGRNGHLDYMNGSNGSLNGKQ